MSGAIVKTHAIIVILCHGLPQRRFVTPYEYHPLLIKTSPRPVLFLFYAGFVDRMPGELSRKQNPLCLPSRSNNVRDKLTRGNFHRDRDSKYTELPFAGIRNNPPRRRRGRDEATKSILRHQKQSASADARNPLLRGVARRFTRRLFGGSRDGVCYSASHTLRTRHKTIGGQANAF
jgi:hypothetical protein